MISKSIPEIAQAFREAFIAVDLTDAPGNLDIFPGGCCSWATWMLGHYLKFECQLEPIEVQAQRFGPDGTSDHAWIEVSGLIVDITSDQFKDCPSPIFGEGNSEWHKSWKKVREVEILPVERLDSVRLICKIKPSEVYKRLVTHFRSQCA